MNLRDALVQQSPSLALQRAAQEEIAGLDSEVMYLCRALAKAKDELYDVKSYLEAHDLTKDFEVWLAMNTEP